MNRPLLATLVVLLCALGASRAEALSCQNRLVDLGDPAARVRSLCGDPADVSTRVEQRSVTVHRRAPNGIVVSDTVSVAVTVERWLYDFGPQRFMQELTFEDGRLRRVEALGYGTDQGRSAAKPQPRSAWPAKLG